MRRQKHGRANACAISLALMLLGGMASGQSTGGQYTLRKSAIPAGSVANGSQYRMVATVGPPAGVSTGVYRLTSGFQQPVASDAIFKNGFE